MILYLCMKALACTTCGSNPFSHSLTTQVSCRGSSTQRSLWWSSEDVCQHWHGWSLHYWYEKIPFFHLWCFIKIRAMLLPVSRWVPEFMSHWFVLIKYNTHWIILYITTLFLKLNSCIHMDCFIIYLVLIWMLIYLNCNFNGIQIQIFH